MADQSDSNGRGFASMPKDKVRKLASEGGHSQGKSNNPGNLANRSEEDRKDTARKGGQA